MSKSPASSPSPFPAPFVTTVQAAFGAAGSELLASLPALLEEVAARWQLAIEPPFPNLTFNYVAPATLPGGGEAVLKIGVPAPRNRELGTECAALELAAGRGLTRLLRSWPERGVLLLERVQPGVPLLRELREGRVSDREATTIAAAVMRELRQAPPATHPFPSVADWFKGFERLRRRFNGATGPFSPALVATAEEFYRDLAASSEELVVLHGDLHHDNILAAGQAQWRAIDPKGLIGEPCFETGAFLRNPHDLYLEAASARQAIQERIAVLEDELGFSRQRMLKWAAAQAVLSGWWCYEDAASGWEGHERTAAVLTAVLEERS